MSPKKEHVPESENAANLLPEKETSPPNDKSAPISKENMDRTKFLLRPIHVLFLIFLGLFFAAAVFFIDAINASNAPPPLTSVFATRMALFEQRLGKVANDLKTKTNVNALDALKRRISALEKRKPPVIQTPAPLVSSLEKRLSDLEIRLNVLKNKEPSLSVTQVATPPALSLLLLARERFLQGAPVRDLIATLREIQAPKDVVTALEQISARKIPTRAALIHSFSEAIHTAKGMTPNTEKTLPIGAFLDRFLSRIKISKESTQDAPRRLEMRILLLILLDDPLGAQKLTHAYPPHYQKALATFHKELEARAQASKILRRAELATLADFFENRPIAP